MNQTVITPDQIIDTLNELIELNRDGQNGRERKGWTAAQYTQGIRRILHEILHPTHSACDARLFLESFNAAKIPQ